MNALMAIIPAHLIVMSRILLSKLIASSTLTNYLSGMIHFSHFCDDYNTPESLCMPASEALLTLFITCCGMA